MSDEGDRDEWIEVRRYNDPLEADMARDFLEKSGVKVLVRGNSGVTGVLNRFDTILDIRLTVPAADLVVAREALEAMQAPVQNESPFRGIGHEKEIRSESQGEDAEAPIPRKKSPFLAMGFGLMLPIGAGHMYAGHQAAGKILALFIIGMSLAAVYRGSPGIWVGVFALVAIDVLFSPFAVNRFNRDEVSSDKKQIAAAALAGLLVVALTVFSM